MFQVVVAEKPSVARDLARILGARTRRDGYLEGNGYRVSWALGHLIRLAEPAEYGGNWRGRWSMKPLPMIPDQWRLRTEKKTVKQFRVLKQLLNDPQTSQVICATDAGREGEHIFRLIYRHAGCRKPVQRLWISSLTDEAIRAGLRQLQPGRAYDNLAAAAEARAKADWLVGLNLTRAYTVRHKTLCTIGRVQTPTLAMIVAREQAVREFVKSTYYEVVLALTAGFEARLLDGKEVARLERQADAQAVVDRLNERSPAVVDRIETKRRRRNPPPLYDLTNLQRDANRRFGMTAATTLKHAQALYETHKLISYPRTESHHISEDMVPGLPRVLEALDHPKAGEALQRVRAGHKLSKAYVDRTKLSDHHGVLPTGRRVPANLPASLRKVYNLVVARFIAIFFPANVEDHTKLWLALAGERFLATGKVVVEPGWKAVDPPPPKKDEKELPPCEQGQALPVQSVAWVEKETKPPPRYTDATLLNAMKTAGKALDDEDLAEAIREAGLGTPATRADIIEKLIRTTLVLREKKVLKPTEKGEALIRVVAEPMRSAEMTAQWEQRLKDIEAGQERAHDFLHAIGHLLQVIIPRVSEGEDMQLSAAARAADQSRRQGNTGKPLAVTCPQCGQGTLFQGKKAFSCDRYRDGCKFSIWKTVAGKALSAGQVTAMVKYGRTPLIKGFRAKSGKRFAARLALQPDGRTQFVFDQPAAESAPLSPHSDQPTPPRKTKVPSRKKQPKDLGQTISERPCPRCGQGHIIAGHRGYGCDRFRQGCHWVLPKKVCNKKIQKRTVQTLLEKGRTGWLKGFTLANGDLFEARLAIEPGGLAVLIDKTGGEQQLMAAS